MLKDINTTTQDISARLNVVETKVLKDISNTTQDISALLNVVETTSNPSPDNDHGSALPPARCRYSGKDGGEAIVQCQIDEARGVRCEDKNLREGSFELDVAVGSRER